MFIARILWGGLLITLMTTVVIHWEGIEPEVEHTALMLTSREILSSANELKNYWLMNGQPKKLVKEGISVVFTPLGWPVVLNPKNQIDCRQWLHLLLPNRDKIYLDRIEHVQIKEKKEADQCNYRIANDKMVSIELNKGVLKVSVEL